MSPPYSADIYWNVTLAALRRELAALYDIDEREMGASVDRITLAHVLPKLRCPLIVSGGGHDLITPGTEAWRIFEDGRGPRELLYYPEGGHECFNVLADMRPRMVAWMTHQLEQYHPVPRAEAPREKAERTGAVSPAEAVDPDFADALRGETHRLVWNHAGESEGRANGAAVNGASHGWRWPWPRERSNGPRVVHRLAPAGDGSTA